MDAQGMSNYDFDDVKVSDDEKQEEYVERRSEEQRRMQKGTQYDDEPYNA